MQRQIERVRTHAKVIVVVSVVRVQRTGLSAKITPPRSRPSKLVPLFGPAVDKLVGVAQKTRGARGAYAALKDRELIENLRYRHERRTVGFCCARNTIKKQCVCRAKLIVRVGRAAAYRGRIICQRKTTVHCHTIGSIVVLVGYRKADAEIPAVEIASA